MSVRVVVNVDVVGEDGDAARVVFADGPAVDGSRGRLGEVGAIALVGHLAVRGPGVLVDARRGEASVLVVVTGQGLVVGVAGAVGVEREVGGVSGDPVGGESVPDVLRVGQPEVLLGGDVAQHGGAVTRGFGRGRRADAVRSPHSPSASERRARPFFQQRFFTEGAPPAHPTQKKGCC